MNVFKNVTSHFLRAVVILGFIYALVMAFLPGQQPSISQAAPDAPQATIGGVNLGDLTNYLFFFADARSDANWQAASKGFVGNVAVDGSQASERTSGTVPYAGTIYTNDSTLSDWQNIVNDNGGQAFASTGNTTLITQLENTLNSAFTQINALSVSANYGSFSFNGIASTSLNGLNTTDSICQTFVINITSDLGVSSQINITGDACDVFIMRWDSDANFGNGYQGQVKFQSGGAIVPLGGLKASNFIHVAGDINSSGGGSNPTANGFPQGPRLNDGQGALCTGCANFNGGGFFTGYWLTTGSPTNPADATHSVPYGDSSSMSNGIFVGGWYSINTSFSMTSGTSGVYVSPNTATLAKDYSDAPDTGAGTGLGNYNTIASDNGPSHVIVSNLRLGAVAPDGDSGTLQNSAATADDNNNTDDEDGVTTLPTVTTASTSVPLTVSVFNNTGSNATVACWIDFNRDGDFLDAGERAAATVSSSASQQNVNLTFTGFAAPTGGTSYLRCRLANASGEVANPTGAANTGEVEDYALVILGVIGDRVWYDADSQGDQDVGEVGINGVTVYLRQSTCSGPILNTKITSGDGNYLFTGVQAGTYCVDVDNSTVPTGYTLTTGNEPLLLTLTAGESRLDADFGYVAPPPTYALSKVLNSVSPSRHGEPISFTIRITNTGGFPITTLPLTDTYDTNYLVYVGSVPPTENNINDGVINWNDLTGTPKGFGVELAPGQSFAIVVSFVGIADTTGLAAQTPCVEDGNTCNVATVAGAKYDPDGPGGIPEQGPLPPKSAHDDVQIIVPTSVSLTNRLLTYDGNVAGLGWASVDESDIAGFYIYRSDFGNPAVAITDQMIPAQAAGQSRGAVYTYMDTTVETNQRYDYYLEVVTFDAQRYQRYLGRLLTGSRILLPSVTR